MLRRTSSHSRLPRAVRVARPAHASVDVRPHPVRAPVAADTEPIKGPGPIDPASLLPIRSFDEAGRRFIAAVPTGLSKRPVRVFAGLNSAPTIAERVDLVMRELERTGAFHRRYLMVAIPTGGGHVNPEVPEALERMVDGDVASVAMQYGTLPSFLSFGKVGLAARLHEILLIRIARRIRQLHPDGGGPRVVLYGESLGAWAGQKILSGRGEAGMRELGLDRVLWLGVPGQSRFSAEGFRAGAVNAFESWERLKSSARTLMDDTITAPKVLSYSHPGDPVHRADLHSILARPSALGADPADEDAAKRRRGWTPVLTFVDSVIDLVTEANQAVPGVFTNETHDYRLELPELIRTAFGVSGVTDARLAAITQTLARSDAYVLKRTW